LGGSAGGNLGIDGWGLKAIAEMEEEKIKLRVMSSFCPATLDPRL